MKRCLLIVLLVGVVTYGSLPVWQRAIYTPQYVQVIGSDEELILAGLKEKKTFLQTFEWYKEKWCGGVSFYRPITSQLFWLEKKVFGDKNLQWWLMAGILFHTATMILGFLVVERIFGSTLLAFFTVILFAGHRIYLPFLMSGMGGFSWTIKGPIGGQHFEAVGMWRNAPEFWVAIPMFVGILGFLDNKLSVTLGCTIIAMLTKETGFGFIPALALISWYKKKTYPLWFWVTGAITTISIFVYRFMVLGSFGYRLGSNNSWWHRAIVYYGGTIGDQLGSRMIPLVVFAVSLGIAIVFFVQANQKKSRRCDFLGLVTIIAGFSIAVIITTTRYWIGPPVPFLIGAMMLLSVNNAWLITSIAFVVYATVAACKIYPRECAFVSGWMLIFSAGLFSAAQVQEHAFYVANFFRTSFYWFGLFGIWSCFRPHIDLALLSNKEGDFFVVNNRQRS